MRAGWRIRVGGAGVFGLIAFRRDGVAAGQPAAKIDIGAAARTEGAITRIALALADRAGHAGILGQKIGQKQPVAAAGDFIKPQGGPAGKCDIRAVGPEGGLDHLIQDGAIALWHRGKVHHHLPA